MIVQQDAAILHIVHVGTHLIHAVGGSNGYHIVLSRFGETTIDQVDGLIATVTQEDILGIHTLALTQLLLQLTLQRIRITVIGRVVRALVGIQKHVGLVTAIFVTGTTVGFQLPNVRTNKF